VSSFTWERTVVDLVGRDRPFEYCSESREFYVKAFKELARVLRKGGAIRIVPISKPHIINDALFEVPELIVTDRTSPDWIGGHYLEIKKK